MFMWWIKAVTGMAEWGDAAVVMAHLCKHICGTVACYVMKIIVQSFCSSFIRLSLKTN